MDESMKPCRFNMMGKCTREGCKFLHFDVPKISEEHCKFYVIGNDCRFDNETCKLRHDEKYKKEFAQKMMQAM